MKSPSGKLRTSKHILAAPARRWLDETKARKRTMTRAEKALFDRLALFLKDERAAEIEAVLEALASNGSSRTKAAEALEMSLRSLYNVLEQPGVQARADAQAEQLGHRVGGGPPRVDA